MRTHELLGQLEPLDHSERLTALVAHTRARSPAQVQALGRELWIGDSYQRLLALVVAEQCGDIELAWIGLGDPSRSVRRRAAKLVARRAEAIPATVLDHLDAVTLSSVYQQVARRRDASIAAVLVDGLIARERFDEAARLLGVCAAEVVTKHLDQPWPDEVWARIARFHPAVLVARIERLFGEDAERPDLVWRRFNATVWASLGRQQPAALADWIDRFADADSLPQPLFHCLHELACWSPERMVDWLGSRVAWISTRALPRGLVKRAHRISDERLTPLCMGLARAAPRLLGQLIARMPHTRRGRLFELAVAPLELAGIEWPTELLALLPLSLRDREAARMLERSRAQTDGSWRRQLLGLRSIEHARPLLESEGRSAQASERGEAHAALIRSSAGSRAGMAQTLAWLSRIRNEQDPVRLAVLTALSESPTSRFDDPAALDLLLAPVFEARDTSWATRNQAARLAQRLLCARVSEPHSPMFSLGVRVLECLAGHKGTLDLPRLDHNLPRGAEQAIVGVLLPWIQAANRREQEQHVFRLWAALGKRAWLVPELAALIAEIIWHGTKDKASHAVTLWLADPKTRDTRVLELVERDPSALQLHAVFQHCLRRRQSLLAERFAIPGPRGRFHASAVVMIPRIPSEGMFTRWTTSLQRRYLALLDAGDASPKQFAESRAALVAMRASVPITRVEDLQAALASADVNVQEAALAGLVWLDEPAPALPILLDHLDGDRARVAMYAMPRLARLLPRDRFVDALARLLERPRLKVTVHKEALRLLGQLGTQRALELLREAWAKPLHRDVRIAALHAARSVPGQDHAWTLMASAAQDQDPDIARAVVELPLTNLPATYRSRYLQLMATIADHSSPIARAALFDALSQGWSSVAPVFAVELAARVIARLDPEDPWSEAALVIAGGARSAQTHPACAELVEQLIAAAELDLAPAGELDQLAHQRLRGLLGALSRDRHPTQARLLERLAAALRARPRWWSAGARLNIVAADNHALGETLIELVAKAPTARCALLLEGPVHEAARLGARAWTDEQAITLLDQLIGGEPGARALALVVLATFGPQSGWAGPFTSRLQRLREDPDLDVRSAALSLWMA